MPSLTNRCEDWRWLLAAAMLFVTASSVLAHQLVFTTGYANSSTPMTGAAIDRNNPPFTGGGGYAVGVRTDLDNPSQSLWISPSFLLWSNLTGSPVHDFRANYIQAELGGRLSVHTHTIPKFYGGVGAGFTVSHGTLSPRFGGSSPTETYDGDFPTASLHAGVKLPNQSTGITVLAEASYHIGLAQARGFRAIGPARAALIQIGIAFDILSGAQP